MRNGKINRVNNGTKRLGQRQRDGVEVSADAQNGRDNDEANGGVGRWGGENERAEQGERDNHAERDPMQKRGLKIIQQRPGVFAAGSERGKKNVKAEQGEAAG